MKVLLNTYPTAFIVPGGGEVQLRETARHLEIQGVETALFDPWNPALAGADIVHFFSVFGGSLPFCQFAKQLASHLVISPGLWPDHPERYPMEEIQAMLDLADLVVPNSHAERELLAERFAIPAEKFAVVYNGVEPAAFVQPDTDLFPRRYGLSRYILCVANIEPRKNQLRLIRALREIPLPLVFLGEVRDVGYYAECRREAGERAIFLPPLPHDSPDLVSAYAGADLFVLPSLLETPGLAALEAAAAGCPRLVVTAVGSAREYFGDRIDYIECPEDETAIQLSVRRALERDLMGRNALRRHICETFTWENSTRCLIEFYRGCLLR